MKMLQSVDRQLGSKTPVSQQPQGLADTFAATNQHRPSLIKGWAKDAGMHPEKYASTPKLNSEKKILAGKVLWREGEPASRPGTSCDEIGSKLNNFAAELNELARTSRAQTRRSHSVASTHRRGLTADLMRRDAGQGLNPAGDDGKLFGANYTRNSRYSASNGLLAQERPDVNPTVEHYPGL